MNCVFESGIYVSETGIFIKDDKELSSEEACEIIQNTETCIVCQYFDRCVKSMIKTGKLYKEEEKTIKTHIRKPLKEMNGENELYHIQYESGNLVISNKETCEVEITVWADKILNHESMGVKDINSLIKKYGFEVTG